MMQMKNNKEDHPRFKQVFDALATKIRRELGGETVVERHPDLAHQFGSVNGHYIPLQIGRDWVNTIQITYTRPYASRGSPRSRTFRESGEPSEFNMDTLVGIVREHLHYEEKAEVHRQEVQARIDREQSIRQELGLKFSDWLELHESQNGTSYRVDLKFEDLSRDRVIALAKILKENGYGLVG